MTDVVIYTDGACKGNPGPGGWGALLRAGTHEKELFGGEAQTTNNRMELTAVIRALESLTRATRAAVYTDSQYVKNGIQTWIHNWKRNGWKTADKKPVKKRRLVASAGRARRAASRVLALGKRPRHRSGQHSRRRAGPTAAWMWGRRKAKGRWIAHMPKAKALRDVPSG